MLHYDNSLSNGVKYYFDTIGLNKKIRPVNRLDKDTSGIVIFAKNEYIQECLISQMKKNLFKKEAKKVSIKTLEKMNINDPQEVVKKYPHQLSGGMLQRCMIVLSLSIGVGYHYCR